MLEVDTTQILDLILPEFKRFLALAAPGGDEDGGFARHLNPFNKKRKPPVAWWSGVIDAGPGGRELRYTVPDYFNGKLRIVAIAANARKVGVAESGTEVKGNFILTPNVPGKSPIRVSQLHRAVAIDMRTGHPACPPYTPGTTRFEVFEFWSSDMLKLFREAGMPRRTPPALPDCASEDSADVPRISSPLRNVGYTLRRSTPAQAIALEASTAADVQHVFWFDGMALIGKLAVGDGAPAWRPAADGDHLLRIIDDHGRAAERDVAVQFVP